MLGVIGHVDHGKTALVRALTGMDTDQLPEEKRRGISIALGFAHFDSGGATTDLIDMPGHERFVRTMISGATGIGAVLLVVAANEGIKPQTIEHAEIAALLGITDMVIAVSKSDLVPPERAHSVGREAAELASALGLQAPVPILTSARSGAGLDRLKQAVNDLLSRAQAPRDDGFPYMPVDRAFTVPGYGTVVTGTLRRGWISLGDELQLVPTSRCVRVRGLQVHGGRAERAGPGERVALNLRGADSSQARRGLALATPELLAASSWLTVELSVAQSATKPLLAAFRSRLLFGTSEIDAMGRLLDRDELRPGQTCFAQLRCTPRIALPVGEHVILRAGSPPRAIAGGCVLDACAQRLRRHDPASVVRLSGLVAREPAAIIAAELVRSGTRGVRAIALARLAGLSPARVQEELRRLSAVISGAVAVTPCALKDTVAAALRVLEQQWEAHPEGLSFDQLMRQLRTCGAEVLELALVELEKQGRVQRASRIRLIRAEHDQARNAAENALSSGLAEAFRRAGLTPPTNQPPDIAARRAMARLVREGILVRTVDHAQKREVLFHRDAVEAARRVLAPLLAGGPGLLVTDVGTALGISRKYSVPLLEHLDAIQFTRRIGDRRVLRATANFQT